MGFDPFVKSSCSDAASGWAGWALAHLEFWSSVNPIQTRGAGYAHLITACPPGFENLAASLRRLNKVREATGGKIKEQDVPMT